MNPGNQPGFFHQSIKKRTVLLKLFVIVIGNYPKYVLSILLLEVCLRRLIAFSLICRTLSRVRSKVSPISSRVIGC